MPFSAKLIVANCSSREDVVITQTSLVQALLDPEALSDAKSRHELRGVTNVVWTFRVTQTFQILYKLILMSFVG